MLKKTKGVPLFQEQAMRLAIVAAKFTPDEANGLRRAMATFRNVGTIGNFEEKLIGFHWIDPDEEKLKQIQSSFSDAQLRIVGERSESPESILPIVVMDSGPAPNGASANCEPEGWKTGPSASSLRASGVRSPRWRISPAIPRCPSAR